MSVNDDVAKRSPKLCSNFLSTLRSEEMSNSYLQIINKDDKEVQNLRKKHDFRTKLE